MEDNILEDKLKCPAENCINRGKISDCYIEYDEKCPYFISEKYYNLLKKRKEKEN